MHALHWFCLCCAKYPVYVSGLDDAVKFKEEALSALVKEMERTRANFLSATKIWLRTALPEAFNAAVERRYSQTEAIGPEGRRTLKGQLAVTMESLDTLVESILGNEALWIHLQGNHSHEDFFVSYFISDRAGSRGLRAGSPGLPDEFRKGTDEIVAKFGDVFVQHGYKTEGYGPLLSLPRDVPAEMIQAIRDYYAQDVRFRSLRRELNQAIDAAGRARARSLWDES